jgi:tRNA pseudouridine55 synthase
VKPDPPGILGIVVVDKPAGPTSFDAVKAVRRAYGMRRVGHTGTLDPFATGILPVCVGRSATRLVPWLQRGDKEYEATIVLGEETDTLDPTGEVVATDPDFGGVARVAVEALLPLLSGTIMQVPPAYSALKVRGQRAYKLARAGQAPELAPRPVELRAAEVLEVGDWQEQDGRLVRLRIRTGPGFYVRALARDLARALGTVGRLEALRRTESGGFVQSEAVALDDLDAANPLIPPADALRSVEALVLHPDQLAFVRVGRLPDDLAIPPGEERKLLADDGRLVAIAACGDAGVTLCGVFDSPQPTG